MQKPYLVAAVTFAALSALTACSSEPEVMTINEFDPQAEALRNAAPVAPPRMIADSRTYRCRDNSLVYIDFYTDGSAAVRTDRGQPAIATLTAEDGNPPYVAEGYSVSANAREISYTAPGKGTQSCRS